MNQLSVVIVALVAFTYFGGSQVPNVLKSNKQILLGVLIGLVLGSFFGVRLVEGSGITFGDFVGGVEELGQNFSDAASDPNASEMAAFALGPVPGFLEANFGQGANDRGRARAGLPPSHQ